MLLAPELTIAERDAYTARCPEEQRWAFRGWLDGTHELDGSRIEPATILPRRGIAFRQADER
jgi:hypothetical protein